MLLNRVLLAAVAATAAALVVASPAAALPAPLPDDGPGPLPSAAAAEVGTVVPVADDAAVGRGQQARAVLRSALERNLLAASGQRDGHVLQILKNFDQGTL